MTIALFIYVDNTVLEVYNGSMVSVIQYSANIIEQWSNNNNDMRITTSKRKEVLA